MNGQIIWESFEGSELRNERTLTNLRPFPPRKKFVTCTGPYQKVKETAFEVFGRSGGVARFSIAAFRAVDRGKRSYEKEAREFKKT